MSVIEESWLPIAKTLGYQSEEEMLADLYVKQWFSIAELGKIVGFSGWSVRRRLIMRHIPLRKRGGDNRSGRRKLAAIPNSIILTGKPPELAIEFGVSLATVFAERRLRKCDLQLLHRQPTSTLQTS